tara:strand:+ start:19416 stop:19862 length:447 start_codon:yes stop_codon:yes gene_type:complete
MKLKVECIWCNTKKEFNKFTRENKKLKGFDKLKNQIISYNDISDKLSKSDPYGIQPSDTIVALQIQKIIKNVIYKNKQQEDYEENTTANITYLLKNLEKENILNFKSFLNDISGGVEFDLIVINREDNLDPSVLSKFDNVKFLDNDKA